MNEKTLEKISATLKAGSPVVTAADVKHGVMEQVQLYFESEGQAVMDVVSKDDLVQNWPDAGAYVFNCDGKFRKVTMFEGEEDMYFRTDGTKEEQDNFGELPNIIFLETLEEISQMSL